MRQIFSGVFLLLLCSGLEAQTAVYEIFTTSFLPPFDQADGSAVVYVLDKPEQVMALLGSKAKGRQKEAENNITNFMATREGRAVMNELKQSFGGVVKAWSHQIKYLPAVLVDGKYVMYGINNLGHARDIYTSYIGEKNDE